MACGTAAQTQRMSISSGAYLHNITVLPIFAWTPVQTASVLTAMYAVINAHSMLLPGGKSLMNLRLQMTQMAQAAVV